MIVGIFCDLPAAQIKTGILEGYYAEHAPITMVDSVLWESLMRANKLITARADYPHVVRHLSWYLDPNNLPEDEAWYLSRVVRGSGACYSVALADSLGHQVGSG